MNVRTPGSVVDALVAWETANGRRFPWRETQDPYTLAVAEVLLQKTKAEAVRPIWQRLIERYPTADDLARASVADIRRDVSGLGLGVQRASRLITMASAMAAGADTMPGLGPYGSGIVALSRGSTPNTPPVDGNVARVVSRLLGLTWRRGEPRKKLEVRSMVAALLATGRSLDVMYGLVDLGAVVCVPRKPACPKCPLASSCATGAATDLDRPLC